jgi:ATP-binding cassette subfamily B protein
MVSQGAFVGIVRLFFKRYGFLFALGLFFVTLEAFCDLLQPTLLSHLIDAGVLSHRIDVLAWQALGMLGVAALGAVAALFRNRLSSVVSQKFGGELRSGLYRRVQGYSHQQFDRFETSTLVTRLTNDVTQIQNFVNGTMRVFAKAPLLGLGALLMAIFLDAKLSLVLLAIVPLVGLLTLWDSRLGFPLFRRVQKGVDKVNSLVREVLRGIRVVKAFDRFEEASSRFRQANFELMQISSSAGRVLAVFNPVVSLVVNLGIVVILWWGRSLVQSEGLGPGKIIAYVNYITQILFALVMMGFVLMIFVRAKASLERLAEVWDARESDNLTPKKSGHWSGPLKEIAFQKVSFRYPHAREPTLSELEFILPQGALVGLLGGTGSGKSTLAKLLVGLYPPSQGQIVFSGLSRPEWDPDSLARQIAWVPQQSLLFSGTIQSNLSWGSPGLRREEMREVARLAGALDFIEAFPEGFETVVGQGGVTLSGGQKQRISLARALARSPSLLILDDALSALDSLTEARILASIKGLNEVTILLIAQKVASLRQADGILVLDQGRLVGSGRRADLVKTCRVFQQILASQNDPRGERHG